MGYPCDSVATASSRYYFCLQIPWYLLERVTGIIDPTIVPHWVSLTGIVLFPGLRLQGNMTTLCPVLVLYIQFQEYIPVRNVFLVLDA